MAKKIGRPKGSLNKRTLDYLEVLAYEDFDPAQALIHCYRESLGTWEQMKKDHRGTILPEDAHRYLKIAADAAKDLAGYAYPRLKAIEQKITNPLDGMTPEQKLEALKQAVALLEVQVHGPKAT